LIMRIMKVSPLLLYKKLFTILNIISEICEDVKEECEKYGRVLEMKIPRPSGGSRQSAGVGKIFVKFDTPESAGKALRALAGRKFADRTVVTTYFSEENFEVSAW
jgi:splicing factor U2AF subunit